MRYKNLDLNLLVALNHFLTEQSVSKAADKMFITQSSASNALSRLREYFDDEILIPVGKNMTLTTRAKTLVKPVKEILFSIDSKVIQKPFFDPHTDLLKFKICVSDYTLSTVCPVLINYIRENNYNIHIDFIAQTSKPEFALEYEDVDLLIIPEVYSVKKHPLEHVFEDDFVCISSKKYSNIGSSIGLDDFENTPHIIMQPSYTKGSVESIWMNDIGIQRKVAVSCESFSMIPVFVANSNYIATIHRRLATQYAENFDLNISELPFEFPKFKQTVQWHRYKEKDQELLFLIDIIKICYQRMANNEVIL